MKARLVVTSRGVVTLPAKLRQALGIRADDQLIAETTPEGLLLRPAITLPVEIYTDQRIREFDEAEAELAKDVHPSGPVAEAALVLPEKDRPVLSAAIRHRCDALITGDRTHFGRFYGKTLGGVAIHSPRSLADRLFE